MRVTFSVVSPSGTASPGSVGGNLNVAEVMRVLCSLQCHHGCVTDTP